MQADNWKKSVWYNLLQQGKPYVSVFSPVDSVHLWIIAENDLDCLCQR